MPASLASCGLKRGERRRRTSVNRVEALTELRVLSLEMPEFVADDRSQLLIAQNPAQRKGTVKGSAIELSAQTGDICTDHRATIHCRKYSAVLYTLTTKMTTPSRTQLSHPILLSQSC